MLEEEKGCWDGKEMHPFETGMGSTTFQLRHIFTLPIPQSSTPVATAAATHTHNTHKNTVSSLHLPILQLISPFISTLSFKHQCYGN